MARKNGEGHFRPVKNSETIEYIVTLDEPDIYGKRQKMRFYGKSEAICRKKYKEFLKKGGEQQPTQTKTYTLSSWLDLWLETYKKSKVEASSLEDYKSLASHIKKHKIGNMTLTAIKPLHITEYFTSKADYSQSFFKKSRFILNAAFETAIDNDYCLKNPVRRAEAPKKVQPEKEAYSESQANIMLNFAKGDELFGICIYIMLNTGIRSGEMRALTVNSISFQDGIGIVTIDKAVKRTEEIGLPKNNKPRYVPLEEDVAEYLQAKLKGKTGYILGGDYFVSRAGFRSRYLWFFDRMNKYLESIGEFPIPYKSPHSTRHTFSTIRQKNGMPIAIVSKILGHCSTEVTDRYTHVGDIETLSTAVKRYKFSS